MDMSSSYRYFTNISPKTSQQSGMQAFKVTTTEDKDMKKEVQ